MASAKEAAGCLLWDIYRPDPELSSPVCTRNHTTRFWDAFVAAAGICGQGCPESCEESSYLFDFDINALDPEETCSDVNMRHLLFEGLNSHTALFAWLNVKYSKWNSYLHNDGRYHNVTESEREGLMERCREKVANDIAILNIQVHTQTRTTRAATRGYESFQQEGQSFGIFINPGPGSVLV